MSSSSFRAVGISSAVISEDESDVLITYSLGSCIGVSLWDKRLKRGGLIHCLLPSSRSGNETEGAQQPSKFVDTGVAKILQEFFDLGSKPHDIEIKAAGGASPLKNMNGFRVGDRNVAMLRKLLWKNGLLLAAEQFGGNDPRTMSLHVDTGRVVIRTGRDETEL